MYQQKSNMQIPESASSSNENAFNSFKHNAHFRDPSPADRTAGDHELRMVHDPNSWLGASTKTDLYMSSHLPSKHSDTGHVTLFNFPATSPIATLHRVGTFIVNETCRNKVSAAQKWYPIFFSYKHSHLSEKWDIFDPT